MIQPFIIYALPRSRTVWLSKFLTYGSWICRHDPLAETLDLEQIARWLKKEHRGIVDTGLVSYADSMQKLLPEARIITVRRKLREVQRSLLKINVNIDFSAQHAALAKLSKQPGVFNIWYDDLKNCKTCEKIFEWCLQQPFDYAWWQGLHRANIQIDIERFPVKL